jgi:hypothetical protein
MATSGADAYGGEHGRRSGELVLYLDGVALIQ